MTFILSEDEALKEAMKGIAVTDNKSAGRSVGVWFGMPDMEIREQSFPFVTIDLIDITEAKERVMVSHGVTPWYYETDLLALADDWTMPYPIPVNLDYQITTYARHPHHDRQILAQVLGNRLPFRFGSLVVTEKTKVSGADTTLQSTVRRLDMVDVAKRDTIESGKRMFMNMFTVRVSSEITHPQMAKYFYTVTTVNGALESTYPDSLSSPDLITTFTITA